jgi:hypothetical protein
MGTATVIKFSGTGNYNDQKSIALYRHMDGDPVTQLAVFAKIIEKAETMADLYAADAPHIGDRCKVTPSTLTGLYIGETTGTFGMAASIMDDPNEVSGEWLYTVDVDKGEILVTDDDENPVDPYSYLLKLHDEYVPSHRAALFDAIADLKGLGFKVLPGEKAER